MASFRLQSLGGCRIESADGTPVDFPAGKALAVLVAVACRSDPPTRRELAHLLWSRKPVERALHSLRQALWLIRKTLGEDVIEAGDTIALRPDTVICDAVALETALAEGRLDDADRLWHGPFLHRFAVADAPEWDRWVDETSRSLVRRFSVALGVAAADHRETGNVERTRYCLERAVEVEPDEFQHRSKLISYLIETRDLRAAGTSLHAASQAFPESERRSALEQLRARLDELRQQRGDGPEARLSRPDLVGRSVELADLLAAWRSTTRGRARLIAVTGPAGIGKTRLVDEFAGSVDRDHGFTVRIQATEVERTLEYGVVASLVRALLMMPGAAGISTASDEVLRGLAPSVPLRGASTRGSMELRHPTILADALTDLIGAVAYERPLLIALDDAHWADPVSISVIARALRTLRDGSVLTVLTARRTDGADGALGPLASAGGPIDSSTIRLRPLTRAETDQLVGVLVEIPDGPASQNLLSRIHATAGGNPFHVIQLLHALLDVGLIAVSGDSLKLDVTRLEADPQWPGGVRMLIRQRLARLSSAAQQLAHLLATVAPEQPEVAARQLAGLGRATYAKTVAELIEHGIVQWDGTRLGFLHDELRDAAATWNIDDEDDTRRRLDRRWVAAAAVLLIAASAAVLLRGPLAGSRDIDSAARPFGGGAVWIDAGDSVIAFTPVIRNDSVEWIAGAPVESIPPADRLIGPFRTTDDSLVWYRDTRQADRGPDIMRLEPGTWAEIPVVIRPFDDILYSLSPDGRYMTFGSAPSLELHDLGLHMARSDGSEARLVRSGVRDGSWSRDGRFLLTIAETPVADSLLVLTPAGRHVASLVDYRIIPQWCGPGGTAMVAVRRPDAGYRLDLWNVDTNAIATVAERVLFHYGCSPDGSAMLVQLLRDERPVWGVLTRDGRFHDFGIQPRHRIGTGMVWVPDRIAPIPTAVSLTRDTIRLDWGGTDSLSTKVVFSDGTEHASPVSWTLADSTLASVVANRITGNRPGTTTVTACVHDWICDTAVVEISGLQTEAVLFAADFDGSLDRSKWITFGKPIPFTDTSVEGSPVLHLHGDGIWADGVLSRQGWSLIRGATLDLEFRLPLRDRIDRQRINVCIARLDVRIDSIDHFDDVPSGHIIDGACVAYPAEELSHFDPATINFLHVPLNLGTWPVVTGILPSDDWVQLAIQVLPDGTASLYLNRRHIDDLRTRLRISDQDDWRIYLAGHDVDTRLEVRNVTLFAGARY